MFRKCLQFAKLRVRYFGLTLAKFYLQVVLDIIKRKSSLSGKLTDAKRGEGCPMDTKPAVYGYGWLPLSRRF